MNKNIFSYIKILSNNKKTQELLIETVGKILLKQNNIENFIKENEDKIIHIRDWVSSVIENNEEWKEPRVLTIEALNKSANKYFQKQNNKIQIIELDETHEKLISNLGDYYIVQMLTPEALDKESKQMQHCIGYGGYDKNLKDEEYQYLSLRDKFNKAHVTLESKSKNVRQLQGKQNKIPDEKYLEKIIPWLTGKSYHNIPWKKIGKYYENGNWIDFKDIKVKENIDYFYEKNNDLFEIIRINNTKIKVDLYFQYGFNYKNSKIYLIVVGKQILYIKLEKEITVVNKNMDIIKKFIQEIQQEGYENIIYEIFDLVLNKNDNKIYSIYEIPDNCKIESDLYLIGSIIEKIPDNLTINGDLIIENCNNFKKLPKGLVINGNIRLKNIGIKELPDDIIIKKNVFLELSKLEKIPDNFVVNGNFELKFCEMIKELPKGLVIKGGWLLFSFIDIEKLPEDINLKECRTVYLDGSCDIKKIPEKLVCPRIYISSRQVDLIKKTMVFKEIVVDDYPYNKKQFFKKYGQKRDLLFAKKIVNFYKWIKTF